MGLTETLVYRYNGRVRKGAESGERESARGYSEREHDFQSGGAQGNLAEDADVSGHFYYKPVRMTGFLYGVKTMVNEELRGEHFETITEEKARHMYDYLCLACDRRPDGLTDPDQALIYDAAYLEQIKGMLRADILQRGIGQERYNGRQKYFQENKSLGQFRAYSDQQRKILGELRLTPVRRGAQQVSIDDDFDKFD